MNSDLSFDYNNSLDGNTAIDGGAMYLLQSTVSLDGFTTFTRNSAEEGGGALYAVGTDIDLIRNVSFIFNSAQNGGALFLKESFLKLGLTPRFNCSFNTAFSYGGGIYHVDNTDSIQCNYNKNTQQKSLEVPQRINTASSRHNFLLQFCCI